MTDENFWKNSRENPKILLSVTETSKSLEFVKWLSRIYSRRASKRTSNPRPNNATQMTLQKLLGSKVEAWKRGNELYFKAKSTSEGDDGGSQIYNSMGMRECILFFEIKFFNVEVKIDEINNEFQKYFKLSTTLQTWWIWKNLRYFLPKVKWSRVTQIISNFPNKLILILLIHLGGRCETVIVRSSWWE